MKNRWYREDILFKEKSSCFKLCDKSCHVSDQDEVLVIIKLCFAVLLFVLFVEVGAGSSNCNESSKAIRGVGTDLSSPPGDSFGHESDIADSLLDVLIEEILDILVSFFNPLLNIIPTLLDCLIKLILEISDSLV